MQVNFNGFGSFDSQHGHDSVYSRSVNTNWDVLKGKKALDDVVDEWYKNNKQALLNSTKIHIEAHSFGGLKACAFLAAIARDKEDGQSILDKIETIHLHSPLPSAEAKSIKNSFFYCAMGCINFVRFWDASTPSIIGYFEELKAKDCKLPNAEINHICANNDEVIEKNPNYPNELAAALIDDFKKPIVKRYGYAEHRLKHSDIPTNCDIITDTRSLSLIERQTEEKERIEQEEIEQEGAIDIIPNTRSLSLIERQTEERIAQEGAINIIRDARLYRLTKEAIQKHSNINFDNLKSGGVNMKQQCGNSLYCNQNNANNSPSVTRQMGGAMR